MKKNIIIIIGIFILLLVSVIGISIYELSPVNSKNETNVSFVIEPGTSKNEIIKKLESNNLIRSAFFGKIVVKLRGKELFAGTYKLSRDLSTLEIIKKLENQDNVENESIKITFVEGKRLSSYIKEISNNFSYTESEIYDKINDVSFLDSLINKYWFITDSIYNENIYYPLEGYLFPDTYEFKKNSTIEEIIYKFLDNLDVKLSDYKDEIALSDYNIHELLTLASIIELEGVNKNDRGMVSGVFYNRLKSGMTLGSDVTTYYAVKKDFSESLTYNDLNSCNGYNTRGNCVAGLPVGPICNAGLSSIAASIEPTDNDYYYFVADSSKKTYFSVDSVEHAKTVARLKSEGKWEY